MAGTRPSLFIPFQSTRPVWGVTGGRVPGSYRWKISIHTPRVGRDAIATGILKSRDYISIHTPRVGRDLGSQADRTAGRVFQSTRPVWDVTPSRPWTICKVCIFQSTRPVWGVTGCFPCLPLFLLISIHTPRVGRDDNAQCQQRRLPEFQSTRPVWGVTISRLLESQKSIYFNPHAPCGA